MSIIKKLFLPLALVGLAISAAAQSVSPLPKVTEPPIEETKPAVSTPAVQEAPIVIDDKLKGKARASKYLSIRINKIKFEETPVQSKEDLEADVPVDESKELSPMRPIVPVGFKSTELNGTIRSRSRSRFIKQKAANSATPTSDTTGSDTPVQASVVSTKHYKEVAISVADWDLSEVLASISEQTGTNVVLVSDNNPKVTVRLGKMPVDEVLRVIGSLTKLTVLELRDGFVLGADEVVKNAFPKEYATMLASIPKTQSQLDAEEDIQTYRCKNVQPSQLVSSLKEIFAAEKLIFNVGPKLLQPQEVDSSGGGGSTSSDSGSGGGSGGNGGGGDTNSIQGRLIIIRGPKGAVTRALKMADRMDVRQTLMSVSVQIHDVNNDAVRDLGISWQGSTNITSSEQTGSQSGVNIGSFSRTPVSFASVLRHLETSSRAKLLANPTLTLLDQEKGYILIGDRLNFPVVIGTNSNGSPIFDVREERVGIYMQVSAFANSKNEVTLKLYPQVSTVTGYREINGGSYPQISTREAKTTLRVKSGESVVLGGLIREEEIRAVDKVPILSQIPIFGELFTRRKTTKVSSQVIISITPTIIEDEE